MGDVTLTRHVFFSFHYQRDIFRVNQIRNIPQVISEAAAGFRDSSLWEEARRKDESVIKGMIDRGLENTSVTVVCIGSQTAGRRFINYEIRQSMLKRNGILGLQINHLSGGNGVGADPDGDIPSLLRQNGCQVYRYSDIASLATWIERAAKAAGR